MAKSQGLPKSNGAKSHRGSAASSAASGFNGGRNKSGTCWSRTVEDVTGTCRRDPGFQASDGNKKIDIPASFSPQGCMPLLWKLLAIALNGFTFYMGYLEDPRWMYFAYLTHWGVVLCIAHSLVSFYNAINPVPPSPPGTTVVSFRTKFAWVLFTVAAHAELLITVVYWTVIFAGEVNMISFFSHGIIGLVLIIDGVGVNTIPVRLRHWFEFCLPFVAFYVIWTVIHSPLVLGLGNPDTSDNDPETTDDVIYEVLDWQNKPEETAILGALLAFVLSPILYLSLWAVSCCRRRYVNPSDASGSKSTSYRRMADV